MAGESEFQDDTDVFDVDASARIEQTGEPQPLFRIYEDSRIAVSKHVGPMWKKKIDAAIKAYEAVNAVWDQLLKYYNNHNMNTIDTPRGVFKRGDTTENIIFSNLNIMLTAVYGKDPNITCSTIDQSDEPFCKAMQALLNTLFRKRDKLMAKPKIKKGVGIGLLTNMGVLKIDYTKKDDSRQMAIEEMTRLTDALGEAKSVEDVEEIYGQIEALDMQMEVKTDSGPGLQGVMPWNLIVDPFAEQPDGLDGGWMCEVVHILTSSLTAMFTEPDPENEEDEGERVLVYKPTHRAVFAPEDGGGNRDEGFGLVMEAIDSPPNTVQSHQTQERKAYEQMYYTECYVIWDKTTRRKMLFHRDDWKWPIWVWDDPLGLSRFFPYFIFSFSMNTGGTVGVGETAYVMDQQDEVNDINRQISRMRKTVFDFLFYNSDKVDEAQAQDFLEALRGEGNPNNRHILGVAAGEAKIADMIEVVAPPQLKNGYEMLFDKEKILSAVNRITNTNDALRGVQFKTNTNVASVNSYQESLKLSVGAKVDVVEDIVADIAYALAELCVMNMSPEEVEALIGKSLAQGWVPMPLEQFNAEYNVELVAGSMEKPNSEFKKKEAIEISQALGQFARAAPATTLMVVLELLAQAFPEIIFKPEYKEAIQQEAQANLSRGQSQPQPGQPQPGQQPGPPGGGAPPDRQAIMALPPEAKQQIVQMSRQGAPPQQIQAFIQQALQQSGQQQQPQPGPQMQPGA